MELFLLGAGMGIVGGLIPSPLHMISLSQIALGRWARGIFVLIGPPLAVDGCLLLLTLFFFRLVPPRIAHDVAYAGGTILICFASYELWELRHKTYQELANSATLSYASVSAALLAEVAAPGTWIYWLTIAGPKLAEGHQRGYLRVVPFFAGSAGGYYGAAVLCVMVLAWGASFHKSVRKHLFLVANVLLLLMGISYLVDAALGGRLR
jgi:threonine/homoserine/homoserine lactone efflux protein